MGSLLYFLLNVFFSKMLAVPHAHQAKILQLPPEQDFVLICNKKAHFFVLGWICFLKLMGMGSPYQKKKIVRLDTISCFVQKFFI